jgi:hypothetical protein
MKNPSSPFINLGGDVSDEDQEYGVFPPISNELTLDLQNSATPAGPDYLCTTGASIETPVP